MNIFATDEDPVLCAHYLDDKRVGKLLMEANQMLSLAVKLSTPSRGLPKLICMTNEIGPGKVCDGFAHKNHPVSIWVRQTRGNFSWTVQHARALASEFEHRFGKEHGSACRTDFITQFASNLPDGELQPFQNSAKNGSLGVDFTWMAPVTEAYRQYLLARWLGDTHAPKWTNRGRPEWCI
jgi:hypothetical protein